MSTTRAAEIPRTTRWLSIRLVHAVSTAGLLAGCAAPIHTSPLPDTSTAPIYKPVSGTAGLPHAVRVELDDGKRLHLHIAELVDGGRFTNGFGRNRRAMGGTSVHHTGIDIAAPSGTPIRASGEGRVVQVGRFGGYGRFVRIRHGGNVETTYGHLSRYADVLKVGQKVRQGQVIGYVGRSGRTTGPHLHFEIRRDGKPVDPLALPKATRG